MGWLSANWIWVLLIVFMLWMHLRHGGMHGGHGDHDRHREDAEPHDHTGAPSDDAAGNRGASRRHGGC